MDSRTFAVPENTHRKATRRLNTFLLETKETDLWKESTASDKITEAEVKKFIKESESNHSGIRKGVRLRKQVKGMVGFMLI